MDEARHQRGTLRELIADNIEPQVIEVFGEHADAWAREHAARHSQRFEISASRCSATRRRAAAAERVAAQPQLRYLHRPANLEDVFLKLTGRRCGMNSFFVIPAQPESSVSRIRAATNPSVVALRAPLFAGFGLRRE